MKVRTIEATFHHTESNRRETRTVTCIFGDRSEYYTLTKVFVIELKRSLVFDKETNEFLVPD
jgi:hypothetical protein